ncbi:universal stress protein [Streptosporangium nondiastaticum]|uniref:Universal stress protein n=1 Tax=Streptosporangium nondiastaticum TaxID=35764 RepID=A0A9X7PF49_9ACTN|nr:universal stress protein [Streptosporangium nondiastaticum]
MPENVTRVVVGVDGSAGSLAALRQAAGEAAHHGAVLCPVIAWQPPGGEAADAVQPAPPDVCAHWERAARDRLSRACRSALGEDARRLRMRPRVVRADAGPALVACAARETDMLVMGAGSHGPVHRLVHGSVSRHCLKHARCPVLVVHPRAGDAPEKDGATRPPRPPARPPATIPAGLLDVWPARPSGPEPPASAPRRGPRR